MDSEKFRGEILSFCCRILGDYMPYWDVEFNNFRATVKMRDLALREWSIELGLSPDRDEPDQIVIFGCQGECFTEANRCGFLESLWHQACERLET